MNTKIIFSIIGTVLAIVGLVIVLGVSDSLDTDILGLALFVGGCAVGLMLTKAPAIAWRELSSYFVSPIAYILIAAYLVVIALIFNFSVLASQRAELEPLFGSMTFVLLFFCPVITMRLISEEARSGTLETMLTLPITDAELAVGKFIGGFAFFVALHVPTLVFVYVIGRQASLDYGTIAASYGGLLLMGTLFISVGLFISSLTENQVIAAFLGIVANLALLLTGTLGRLIRAESTIFGLEVDLGAMIRYASVGEHYLDFTRGIVSSQHVLYYITVSVFFLFLTVRMLESHRWR